MSPYKLVKGTDKNLAAFETQVNQALDNGYDLANDLVVHPISAGGNTEFMLFQALVNETVLNRAADDEDEEFEDDDEDLDEDDDFEDYDEEEDE